MAVNRLDFEGPPNADAFDADYTLVLPHRAVCELIAGRVPHDVLVACLSAVKALTEEPAASVQRPRKRRAA